MSVSSGSGSGPGGGAGGGSRNPYAWRSNKPNPFGNKPGTPSSEVKKFATNQFIVVQIVNDRAVDGGFHTPSAFGVSCNGPFEQALCRPFFERDNAIFRDFINITNAVPHVFYLGAQGNPMMNGSYQKKAIFWTNTDGNPATLEQIKDFCTGYLTDQVKLVVPFADERTPIWDDVQTYTRYTRFDEILDDHNQDKMVKFGLIPKTVPVVRDPSTYYKLNKNLLYTVKTPGTLSFRFKVGNSLTNHYLEPADHYDPPTVFDVDAPAANPPNIIVVRPAAAVNPPGAVVPPAAAVNPPGAVVPGFNLPGGVAPAVNPPNVVAPAVNPPVVVAPAVNPPVAVVPAVNPPVAVAPAVNPPVAVAPVDNNVGVPGLPLPGNNNAPAIPHNANNNENLNAAVNDGVPPPVNNNDGTGNDNPLLVQNNNNNNENLNAAENEGENNNNNPEDDYVAPVDLENLLAEDEKNDDDTANNDIDERPPRRRRLR